MFRVRYVVAVLAVAAGIGAGATWAASGGTTTSPSTTTPSTTTPSTTPAQPGTTHHCPNAGSSSSGASYAPTTGV